MREREISTKFSDGATAEFDDSVPDGGSTMDASFKILLLIGGVIALLCVVMGLYLLAKRLTGETEVDIGSFGKVKTTQNGAIGLFFGAFLFVFSSTAYSHAIAPAAPPPPDYELWTISGKIDGLQHGMKPVLTIEPPDERVFSDGVFYIRGFPFQGEVNTTSALVVTLDGYEPVTVHLTKGVAQAYEVTFDKKEKLVYIAPFPLKRTEQPYDSSQAQTPKPLATH